MGCVFIASSVWELIVNNDHTKTTKRTLNTRKILLRSDLQPAIVSLSLAAWKNRVTTFRSPCLMVFLRISATTLKSDRKYRQRCTQCVHWWCNSHRELVDCINHRVVKVVQTVPPQSPVEGGTNTSAGQPETLRYWQSPTDASRSLSRVVYETQWTVRNQIVWCASPCRLGRLSGLTSLDQNNPGEKERNSQSSHFRSPTDRWAALTDE